jgi:hypothetical protein
MKTYTEVYVLTNGGESFLAKTRIREALADAPGFVKIVEVVSGTEWTVADLVEELAKGKTLTLIGPTPISRRKYTGTIRSRRGRLTIS